MPSNRIVILIILMFILVAGVAAWWFFTSPAGSGGAVAVIKQRGKLIVAVREDAGSFSRRDQEGEMVGLEPDLARDLAERLGVELELRPVREADRVQVIQDGGADILLAGLPERDGLEDLVWFVEPAYYAGGANVLVRAGAPLDNWQQLEGWSVCAVQGADYNDRVSEQYGAQVVVYKDADAALKAFDTGECRALLSDESWLISLLVQPDYAEYDVPLSHIEGRHWYAIIRHDQPALHRFVKRAVKDWHKGGRIVELEQKWNVRPSDFAARMHGGKKAASAGGGAAGE